MEPLALTEVGDGTRPVVFVHGLFGQGRNFSGVARRLLDRLPDLRIAMVDLPNHGRSPWTDRVDYLQMAQALAETLERWSPGVPVALVGHSLGGRTAMQLALRRPELVERLVVVDVSPIAADQTSSVFAGLIAALRRLDLASLASREEADEHLAPLIPNDVIRGFLLQNLRRGGRGGAPVPWHWTSNLDVLEADLDAVSSWPDPGKRRYEGPVLWLRGALSNYVRPEYRPAMEAMFPHTRLVTVKNASHWVHSEQPEAFVETLAWFLGQPGGLSPA